jgi:hypothetical protein
MILVWTNRPFERRGCHTYLGQLINFHVLYYPLYMLIMQVYHNYGCMRDFDRMPDSDRISWLWSHFQIPVDVMTPIVSPDSGRASRLWLMSVPCRMPYHLSRERIRMARLEYCNILQPEYLVRSRLGGTHDLFSVQNLSSFACSSVRPCATRPMDT